MTIKGKFLELGLLTAPSKCGVFFFFFFLILLPLVYDSISALPGAIFLNKLVLQLAFYDLMTSSSEIEMLIWKPNDPI